MNLDNFLKSQTFKTGMFVLLVLFVFLIVFKLGVLHGYKKVIYKHGNSYNQTHKSIFFGHNRGVFNKDIYEKLLLKKTLIEDTSTLDSKTDEESGAEDATQ